MMKFRAFPIAVALFLGTLAPNAHAVTATVPFAGAVASTCVLTVGVPGVVAPNADFTALDSREAAGTSGTVAVLTTGTTFSLSADAPTGFNVAPTGGGDNVTFEARYQATGATTIGATLGTVTTPLNLGLTTASVDLTATKSAGVFPQGAYEADIVVRCE